MKSWALIAKRLRCSQSRSCASRRIPRLCLVAFACLLSLSAAAQTSLRVTIQIDSVVLMTVSDAAGSIAKNWGKTSATLSLPIATGKHDVTANIDASGMPNDNGCTILARLSSTTTATVSINGKQLSSTGNVAVADATAYPSSASLAIEASAPPASGTLPAVLLTCQPK